MTAAELVITDGGCWIRTGGAFQAVPDQNWNPARYLGDEVVLAGTAGLRPTPMSQALEALVRGAFGTLGRSAKSIDRLTFIHPTHWGTRRIRQLEEVGPALGCAVSCTPFASAVVRRRGQRGVTLVVECGELSTCASVVGADGRISESRYAPTLGSGDVAESPDRAAQFGDLVSRPGIDQVLITGRAELDRIAAQSVRAVVAPDPAGLEQKREPVPSLGTRLATVPRVWWVLAGALMVAVVVAVTFLLIDRPESAKASDKPQTIAFGRAHLLLPPGWTSQERDQDSGQRRIDLSLGDRKDLRIIVTQNSVPEATTLDDAKRSLRRQMLAKADTFSDLEDLVYGGRQTIFYTEHPTGDTSEIRWYTMIDRGVQTSVGCQFRPGVWHDLAATCEQVVASVDVVR
ncbi:type VII secretion-associated protein [Smaragdicoccus niigatensis]|uniref:type VII secretion-associated protein n=1 Tax=Smaragdicoccus niigatensis TaxID=359359 RepID=UPI000767AD0F|nr:type VII secretion-associated protein [Smaragdicoccus niigatensis]